MDATKFYDVMLYLHYNLDEIRPYKLSSTIDDSEIPSPALIRRLNKYFEPFLKMDLTSALLQISEFQNEFVWDMFIEEDDKDDIETYEDETDEENTGVIAQYLHRDDKVTRSSDSMGNRNGKITSNKSKIETCDKNVDIYGDIYRKRKRNKT